MRLDRDRLRRLDLRVPAGAAEVVRFAAAELSRYLERISGVRLAPAEDAAMSGPCLALGAAPGAAALPPADGFDIAVAGGGVRLAGASDGALLLAAYRLLEQLGCRWSFHGPAHEVIPPLPPDGVALRALREAPRFRVRGYASDLHTWHYHQPEHLRRREEADAAFADWMGKTGATGFLFIRHPFDTALTVPALLPHFRRRGIAPEYGGHVMPLLVPRELLAAHPEYFPQDRGGRRHDLGNLCTGSAAALRLAADNAVRYAGEHPEMGVLHVWGADLWDGGWCHCGACAGLSAQDQSLRACNAVAARLREAGRELPVCYLAYHDTIEPHLTLAPDTGVWVEFAPRERCYGHALNDPACAANRRYREAFERYVERFAGRVRVFEYYGDSILFCGCAVPLTGVIDADLDYYHRAGAREITFLQFGAHSLWAHPLNFLAFAAASWGRADEGARDAYCSRLGRRELAKRYWRELEAAMSGVVTYADVLRPPRRRAAALRPRIEAAIPVLDRWRERLAGADGLAQAALLEYTASVLRGVAAQLGDGAAAEADAGAWYDRALESVRRTDPFHLGLWGELDLPVIHAFHRAHTKEA